MRRVDLVRLTPRYQLYWVAVEKEKGGRKEGCGERVSCVGGSLQRRKTWVGPMSRRVRRCFVCQGRHADLGESKSRYVYMEEQLKQRTQDDPDSVLVCSLDCTSDSRPCT